MIRRFFIACAFVVCGFSCAPAGEGRELDDTAAPIIHGQASGVDQDAVVRLVVGDANDEVCSGTLIAPNAVLSARHCFARRNRAEPLVHCRVVGQDGTVAETTPDYPYDGNVDARSVSVTIGATFDPDRPPQAKGLELVTDDASTMCEHDVVVLILDRSLSGAAPRAVRVASARVGEELTAVGWGFTELTSASGQLVLPTQRVQRPGVAVLATEEQVITYHRHGGGDIVSGAMKGELIVGESVCNGDSGGPLFDADGQIVGVTSRRVSNVSVRCIDTPAVFSHAGSSEHLAVVQRGLARAASLQH